MTKNDQGPSWDSSYEALTYHDLLGAFNELCTCSVRVKKRKEKREKKHSSLDNGFCMNKAVRIRMWDSMLVRTEICYSLIF